MKITVRLAGSLTGLTGGRSVLECGAAGVAGCIDELEARFPGIKGGLCDEEGKLKGVFNIYVNGENVKYLQGAATPLKDGDEVSIVPAIAGG
ncbi:MAG: MoaD/ThiS family protein [Bacillota bacterium]